MTTNTSEDNIEQKHNLQQEADRISISSQESTLTACDLEQQLPKEAKKEEEEEPYCIFSRNKKLLTIIICCLTGIISPLSANAYFPALNAIQEVRELIVKPRYMLHVPLNHVFHTCRTFIQRLNS